MSKEKGAPAAFCPCVGAVACDACCARAGACENADPAEARANVLAWRMSLRVCMACTMIPCAVPVRSCEFATRNGLGISIVMEIVEKLGLLLPQSLIVLVVIKRERRQAVAASKMPERSASPLLAHPFHPFVSPHSCGRQVSPLACKMLKGECPERLISSYPRIYTAAQQKKSPSMLERQVESRATWKSKRCYPRWRANHSAVRIQEMDELAGSKADRSSQLKPWPAP